MITTTEFVLNQSTAQQSQRGDLHRLTAPPKHTCRHKLQHVFSRGNTLRHDDTSSTTVRQNCVLRITSQRFTGRTFETSKTHLTKRLCVHSTFHVRSCKQHKTCYPMRQSGLLSLLRQPSFGFTHCGKTALLRQNVESFQTQEAKYSQALNPNMFYNMRHIDRVWSFYSPRDPHNHVTCGTCLSVLTLWSAT